MKNTSTIKIMSTLLTIYYVAICIAGCDTTGASAPTTMSVTRPTTAALSAVITPHKKATAATTETTMPTTTEATTATTTTETTVPMTAATVSPPEFLPTGNSSEFSEESESFVSSNDSDLVEETPTSELDSDFGESDYFPPATTEATAVAIEEENSEYGIFVDISAQELRYYENGELILSSPVVTGMEYSTPTPTGKFWVNNKAQDIILYGDDYESPVEYWISFLGSGYGFHDASWRTEFGRDLYLYDGSHGCVNMPLEKVADLYYLVKIGTPVFIIE